MVRRRQYGLRLRESVSFLLGLSLFLTVLLACSFGSKKCTATLTYQGKTYEGIDAKKEKAISNACNKYCRDDDPEYDAMYRIWLDSPAGRTAGRPSKQEAIYKSDRLLDFVTVTCANRCVAWTQNGAAKVTTDCN
ncbi:MAG TPA: hypothetical protein VJT71_06770 [Pyrinomonadaceae bacterium]|nr:hypothetical protein [Pyrinomonadaceae bacterium]